MMNVFHFVVHVIALGFVVVEKTVAEFVVKIVYPSKINWVVFLKS